VWYVVIFRIPLRATKNTIAKFDGPMTCGYGIDASNAAQKSTMRSIGCMQKFDDGAIRLLENRGRRFRERYQGAPPLRWPPDPLGVDVAASLSLCPRCGTLMLYGEIGAFRQDRPPGPRAEPSYAPMDFTTSF
jgi:hypothetical protein